MTIAIDGKFKHFEDDHDLSNDNSRKVVESFPNLVYYCYPNITEIDGLRIDTLAYNSESNAFVIIEDKKDRNFSVVDQGMAYLNLMLNNKADFILEYNDKHVQPLKRGEVDWSQSRIIFIAPEFTNNKSML